MSEAANLGQAFAEEGPKYNCPHCSFPNPKPQQRLLEEVAAVLCKRCQQGIPVEVFDSTPDKK